MSRITVSNKSTLSLGIGAGGRPKCACVHGDIAIVSLIPRLEGIRRLGISVSAFEDWSNPRSPRFKPDLPKLHNWPGQSRAKYFRSDELGEFIDRLTNRRSIENG
jgi:hypothetical protein